jgi:catechol 2,3-dioxygenase-like lactoylglutathione lyase family enzyme
MTFLGIDHVDLRVPSLGAVESFYGALFPRLGLTKIKYAYVDPHGDWHDPQDGRYNTVEWYEDVADRPPAFVGIIEDADMAIVRTRVAFALPSRAEVERWAREELPALGAREIELMDIGRYVAVFFTDPVGTRLELVARAPRL